MSENYTNLSSTTLAQPYTPGDGVLVVVSASSFPEAATFTVNCEDVLYTVTAVSGNNLSVTLEFGPDKEHAAGKGVDEVVSKRVLDQLKTDIVDAIDKPITGLAGDVLASGEGTVTAILAASGVEEGTYVLPTLTVDLKGRITEIANGGIGSALAASTPGSLLYVDSLGRLGQLTISGIIKSNGTTFTAAVAGVDYENPLTFLAPFSRQLNQVSMPRASASQDGYLAASDFASFANRAVAYTPENVANKSGNPALGESETFYPTQHAVKTYVDNTAEMVANKATSTALGISDTLYPTQNAVKVYVDTNAEAVANKATSTSLGTSDTLYPTQNAVKSYVDTNAEMVANKSTEVTLGTSDVYYPTQKAVKTYVDDKFTGIIDLNGIVTAKGFNVSDVQANNKEINFKHSDAPTAGSWQLSFRGSADSNPNNLELWYNHPQYGWYNTLRISDTGTATFADHVFVGFNLQFWDNSGDIGAPADYRPRHVYVGSNIVAGGTITAGGTLASAGLTTSGNILFLNDNSNDIGASGAGRPRDLWVGRNVFIVGNVGIGTDEPGVKLDVQGNGRFYSYDSTILYVGSYANNSNATVSLMSYTAEGVSKEYRVISRAGDGLALTDVANNVDRIAFNAAGVITLNGTLQVGTPATGGNTPTGWSATLDSDGSAIIARSGVVNPMELWLGVNQQNLYTSIQSAQAGVGFDVPLLLQLNGGNVGIGTTVATNLLSIGNDLGNTDWPKQITLGNTGAACGIFLGQAQLVGMDIGWSYDATPANAYGLIQGRAGSYNLVFQRDGGNVGIGTTPRSKLEVKGTVTYCAPNWNHLYAKVYHEDSNIFVIDALGDTEYADVNPARAGAFKLYVNKGSNNGTPTTKTLALYASSLGNIGIGTDSPITGLTLGEQSIPFIQYGTSATATDNFHVGIDGTNPNRKWAVWGGNYGYGTNFLTVKQDGNVGIAVADPKAKLHVVGSILLGSAATSITTGFNGEFGNPNVGGSGGFRFNKNSSTADDKVFSSYHANSGLEFYHAVVSAANSKFVFTGGGVNVGTNVGTTGFHVKLASDGASGNNNIRLYGSSTDTFAFIDGYHNSGAPYIRIGSWTGAAFGTVKLEGNVGMGTANPYRGIHLARSGGYSEFLIEATDAANDWGKIWGILADASSRNLILRRGNSDFSVAYPVLTLGSDGNATIANSLILPADNTKILNLPTDANGNTAVISFNWARYIAMESWNLVLSNYNAQSIMFKDENKTRMLIGPTSNVGIGYAAANPKQDYGLHIGESTGTAWIVGNTAVTLGANVGNGKYIVDSNAAAKLQYSASGLSLQVAPAGTAGATITQWTSILTVNNSGYLYQTVPTTAVTDGTMIAKNLCVWLDEANNRLVFRVKYSNGTTLKTGYVTLA